MQGEPSRREARRVAAHEERLGPKKVRNRSDRSRAERDDLSSRVPAHALTVERALELSPDEGDHERAHRRVSADQRLDEAGKPGPLDDERDRRRYASHD